MKVFLGAFGDPGHAFPMIALGCAMRARGHSVTIETAERWREDCEAEGLVFDGVDEALRVPRSEIRLFGKPESFERRRMGVALVRDEDVEKAREQARLAASKVRPRRP